MKYIFTLLTDNCWLKYHVQNFLKDLRDNLLTILPSLKIYTYMYLYSTYMLIINLYSGRVI